MGKSEQTGGGGGTETTPRKEPKPKQKRPWRKPRLHLVEFAVTEGMTVSSGRLFPESSGGDIYDPNIS